MGLKETLLHMVQHKIVFVGRLELDTGILKFLQWLKKNKKYKIDFCGDGNLKSKCEKCGIVHGFCDPKTYYKKAQICVPGGYLAALEALKYGCQLKLFWDNPIKKDYWKLSPFVKKDDEQWSKNQTWKNLTNDYLKLWRI